MLTFVVLWLLDVYRSHNLEHGATHVHGRRRCSLGCGHSHRPNRWRCLCRQFGDMAMGKDSWTILQNSSSPNLQAFYINLVIGALLAPAYVLILPDFESNAGMPLKEKWKKTDWIGTVVLMGGSAFLIMAMNFGGSVFAWNSKEEIAFWVMTGVFLIFMVLVTKFHPLVSYENKLYPSHFLKNFELVNLQIQMFMVSGLMFVSSRHSGPHAFDTDSSRLLLTTCHSSSSSQRSVPRGGCRAPEPY
jgi:hypothetical protein